MTLTLGSVSSSAVDGRCTGCGRFIAVTESHFHSPPKKFRGPPRVHIWADGGAMVTRCENVEYARDRLMWAYARKEFQQPLDLLGDGERQEVEAYFPLDGGRVERGRVMVQPPESEYSWVWYPLPDDAKGPGITTAVVWYW